MRARQLYRSLGASQRIPSRYRASYRRLQRIRWHDDWPLRMWVLLIALIILAVMVPRLAELHYEIHHPRAHHR